MVTMALETFWTPRKENGRQEKRKRRRGKKEEREKKNGKERENMKDVEAKEN